MSEKNRNIDELFRQELGNTTEDPPSSVWEILEQRLDQKSKSDRSSWRSYLLFGLLLLAVFVATYVILHNRTKKSIGSTEPRTDAVGTTTFTPGNSGHPSQNQADTLASGIAQNKQEPSIENAGTEKTTGNKQEHAKEKTINTADTTDRISATQSTEETPSGTAGPDNKNTPHTIAKQEKSLKAGKPEKTGLNPTKTTSISNSSKGTGRAEKKDTPLKQTVSKPEKAQAPANTASTRMQEDERKGKTGLTPRTIAGTQDLGEETGETEGKDIPRKQATAKPEKTQILANTTSTRTEDERKGQTALTPRTMAGTIAPGKGTGGAESKDIAGKQTAAKPEKTQTPASIAAAGTHKTGHHTDKSVTALGRDTVKKQKTLPLTNSSANPGADNKNPAAKTTAGQGDNRTPLTPGKQAKLPTVAIKRDSVEMLAATASKELRSTTANGAKKTGNKPAGQLADNKVSLPATTGNSTPQSKQIKKNGEPIKSESTVNVSSARTSKALPRETEIKPVPESSKPVKKEKEQGAGEEEDLPADKPGDSRTGIPVPMDNTDESGGSDGDISVKVKQDKAKRSLNMSIGVKAAYERGFQSYTANKFIASIFGEVNFSEKISFIIQPGIRLANTSGEYRSTTKSYIRAGTVESSMYYEERDSMSYPTGFKNYAYRQTYDSIVASQLAQKRFTEIELPFLFRYKMDKNLSLLAGMNFTFGKTLKMEGSLKTFSGLSLTDTIFHHYDTAGITPPASGKFSHPGSDPFSEYKDPAATELINLIRFGYTIGLSYTVKQRLIVDLTIQQNLSRLSDINDQQIKKLFTQPYIRLSVGYSILGRRK